MLFAGWVIGSVVSVVLPESADDRIGRAVLAVLALSITTVFALTAASVMRAIVGDAVRAAVAQRNREDEDLHCFECAYPLRGIPRSPTGIRCPECGHNNTSGRATGSHDPAAYPARWLVALRWLALCILLATVAPVLLSSDGDSRIVFFPALALGLLMLLHVPGRHPVK